MPRPPAPERRPVKLEAHGDVRVDDWYWLRDKDDPAVIGHLEAENAYTEAVLSGTERLRLALYDEMVARIEETDLSVPVRKGPWLYYGRTVEGSSYGIHCRRPVGPAGTGPDRADPGALQAVGDLGDRPEGEEVLLDENELARGHEYFAVGNLEVSPDHRWLAYSTDTTGGERYTMRFTDLSTGQASAEALADTSYGVAWANDNATVFYVRVDEAMRPYQVWRHRVGTEADVDTLVYEEPDHRFYVGVGRTKDDRYVLVGLDSKVTSEYHALRADDPEGRFEVIEPRRQGIEYTVDHDRGDPSSGREGRYLIVTNDGAEDFRLMEAPDHSPGRARWREVIPARAGVRLDAVDPFADHLVVYEREGGETRARVIDAASGSSTAVDRPDPATVWGGAEPRVRVEDPPLRVHLTGDPPVRLRPGPRDGTSTLMKRQPVLGDFDPSRYRTARHWATADDGTRVPLSLVYRPDRVGTPDPRGPRPAFSTGTAPTRCPSTRPSRRCASASSTGASSSPSPTSGAGARWAGPGTSRASSWPSPPPSPTSWPAPTP